MSNLYGNFDAVRDVKMSPAVACLIEERTGGLIVKIEQCLETNGYRFHFRGRETLILGEEYIECLEREADGRGLMSWDQFKNVVSRDCLPKCPVPLRQEVQPELQQEIDPSTINYSGTIHGGTREKDFERTMEDEVWDVQESDADRSRRRIRKVYWYRRLKNNKENDNE